MSELPSGLAMVWAQRSRPEAEPRTGLSRGRIVAAAIELADADGLGALSMSKVAARLGFTTMSLYRHVRSKDELILLMQDAAVGAPTAQAEPAGGWRAELEWWAWEVLARFRAHPWILQTIPMLGPPATPNQLSWLERGLRALGATPLTEAEKLSTMLLIDAHVLSDLQFAAFEKPTADVAVRPDSYRTMLSSVLDPQRFPALLRAVEGGAFDPGEDPAADRDADFAFGLARILDGIESLLRQRAKGGRPSR
ncbi:MAG: TetR/AcrR family transcriptional regulator [Pseudonocardiaceae bacterium]